MIKGIITFGVIVVLALIFLAVKSRRNWKKEKKEYARIQSGRAALSDEAFCEALTINVSFAPLVSIIRSKIAELGCYDPHRIYPNDKFYSRFGLDYDDDAAMYLQEMKIIEGYREYSFPLEEVETVGDFVKVILRLKKEFEEQNTLQK